MTSPTPHSGLAMRRWRPSRLAQPPTATGSGRSQHDASSGSRRFSQASTHNRARSWFPVRFELNDLLERVLKVTTKTHRPIVDEHVGWRLLPGHRGHVRKQVMLPEPSADLCVMPRREYDDVETTFGERAQELLGAGTRCVPVVGVLPPGVGVEYAIQVDADQRPLRVFEINFPGLPSHPDQTTISG